MFNRYIVKGYNNTTIEMYERETLTYIEAVAVANAFSREYGADTVAVIDKATNKIIYTIGF